MMSDSKLWSLFGKQASACVQVVGAEYIYENSFVLRSKKYIQLSFHGEAAPVFVGKVNYCVTNISLGKNIYIYLKYLYLNIVPWKRIICNYYWAYETWYNSSFLGLSLAMGTVSARTEPLSHGLMVYWFQKNLMVWFGLVWILDKRFGSKTRVYRFTSLV